MGGLLLAAACGGEDLANNGASAPISVTASVTTTTRPEVAPTTEATTTSRAPAPPVTLASTTTTTQPEPFSDEVVLEREFVVRDDGLQPKSIVAVGDGRLVAQNMMYRHNVTVLDSQGVIVAVVDDTIELADLGLGEGRVQGSPVEAAVSADGAHVYVSNYKLYGPGWNPVADDDCNRGDWDPSLVYRISTATWTIDDAHWVGAVPKFLATSPDGRWLVVANWCSFDVSVIDLALGTERRVDVGRHPRGVAITADSSTAYVAVMGEARIDVVDLVLATVVDSFDTAGPTPRHLVLGPDDTVLYVSNNLAGTIRALDTTTGEVLATVTVGTQPRTMALAPDGRTLYVVTYRDDELVVVRAADLTVAQRLATGNRPVGVTVDPVTQRVWVADYAGSLSVFGPVDTERIGG